MHAPPLHTALNRSPHTHQNKFTTVDPLLSKSNNVSPFLTKPPNATTHSSFIPLPSLNQSNAPPSQ